MKFKESELTRFDSLDEVEKEVFSKDQIKDIHRRASRRSRIRRTMSESISKTVAAYMAKEKIGFNELTRRLDMSPATASKILRGDANLTLETIAIIAQVIGAEPSLSFENSRKKNSEN